MLLANGLAPFRGRALDLFVNHYQPGVVSSGAISRLRDLGWSAQTPFPEGLRSTYDWFRQEVEQSEARGLQTQASLAE